MARGQGRFRYDLARAKLSFVGIPRRFARLERISQRGRNPRKLAFAAGHTSR
jgi:hypothetical protein